MRVGAFRLCPSSVGIATAFDSLLCNVENRQKAVRCRQKEQGMQCHQYFCTSTSLAAVFVSLLVWVLKYHTCLASGRDLPHLFCMQKCLPKYAEVFLVPLHVYGDVYKYTALPTLNLKPLHANNRSRLIWSTATFARAPTLMPLSERMA